MLPFRVKHSEIVAGIFLFAIGISILVMLGLMIKQNRLFEKKVSFYTVFNEGYGLSRGGKVKMSGINVGTINDVLLNDDNLVHVDFSVVERFVDRIRQDSKILVDSPPGLGGVIGGSGIKITIGSKDKSIPVEGEFIESESPKSLNEILNELQAPQTLELISSILKNVNNLLANLSDQKGPLFSTLTTVKEITKQIAVGRGELGGTIIDARKLISQVSDRMLDVKSILKDVKSSTVQVENIANKLPEMSLKVDNTLLNVEKSISQVTTITDNVNTIFKKVDAQVDTVLPQVPVMLSAIRNDMREVEEILRSLKRNWLIQRNLEDTQEILRNDSGSRLDE